MEQVAELTGHVGIIYSLQVIEAPGQTRLFSTCYDKTLGVSTVTVAYRDVCGKGIRVCRAIHRDMWKCFCNNTAPCLKMCSL